MARDHGKTARDSSPPAVVDGEDVRVEEVTGDVGVGEAKRRFGGLDVPATLAGMLAALGTALVIGGVLSAVGAFAYDQGLRGTETAVAVAGLVAGLVTLLVAFLLGGWVAGRIARYDGGRNGLMTAVWFLLLVVALSALGAWAGITYDLIAEVQAVQWPADDGWTVGAIISGVLALAVMLAAGFLGGKWGERYHRYADALITHTRPGGLQASRPLEDRGRDGGSAATITAEESERKGHDR